MIAGGPLLVAGATAGAGLAMILAALRPGPPDLTAALARLDATGRADLDGPGPGFAGSLDSGHDRGLAGHPSGSRGDRPVATVGWPVTGSDASTSAGPSRRAGFARWLRRGVTGWLAGRSHGPGVGPWPGLRLHRLAADLRLIGQSVEELLVRKLGYGVLGVAFPPFLVALMAVIGLRLPWPIPVAASVVLGAVLFTIPDLEVRRHAAAARAELRQATCAYLDLVALERIADAGATEALERAATIGTTQAFARIRDALTRARLDGAPAWTGLTRLGEDCAVSELGDVADIMRLSGQDGAAVYATLRARATSLRTALSTQAAAVANAASEHMVIPVAALGLVFMALVGYPAFARLVFGP